MPIFEYHCRDCDKDFEILILGDQEVSCPVCKGDRVSRLLSVFSHKSSGELSSSKSSSCTSCSATSCSTCSAS